MPKTKPRKKRDPVEKIEAAITALEEAVPHDLIAVVATGLVSPEAVTVLRTHDRKKAILLVNGFLQTMLQAAELSNDKPMVGTLKLMKVLWGSRFRGLTLEDLLQLRGVPGLHIGVDPGSPNGDQTAIGRVNPMRNRAKDKQLYGKK